VAAAVAAGCALGGASTADAAAAPRAAARVPAGFQPMSTSWLSTQRGLVLGYASRQAGSKPYLITTADGGSTWSRLGAPGLTYPDDGNQVDALWEDPADIVATDGVHVTATHDGGTRWSSVTLSGVPADPASSSIFIEDPVVFHGRLFVLVLRTGTDGSTATVYSGPVSGNTLRPVAGLSVSGTTTYGDITAVGALQVDLGSDYAGERYLYSRDGAHFTSAPLPCPASTVTLLGSVRDGKVVALCNGAPGDVSGDENDKQVWTAPALGAAFSATGAYFVSSDQEGFAAASAQDMVLANGFSLMSTTDGGTSWTTQLPDNYGTTWYDLQFAGPDTGYVVEQTVNDSLAEVSTLYRTTDAGRIWEAMTLP
jgi:photosystem II stability/assembly factor-like uncharacterized protein